MKWDGAVGRVFGESAIDTVLNGIYQIGTTIKDDHFVNADGNATYCVSDVAAWLDAFLAPDLAAGTLVTTKDIRVHGTTGTGLDTLVDLIENDPGLQHNISQEQINIGAINGDKSGKIILEAIRATGIADDGKIDKFDIIEINKYIYNNYADEWAKLHGNDENGIETGFHYVEDDGGTSYFMGRHAVDTVVDSIYHLGFVIVGDRLTNEDGNENALLTDVADWMSVILAKDLQSGTLASNHDAVDTTKLGSEAVYWRNSVVTDNGSTGSADLGPLPRTAVANGTFAVDFTANHPDDGQNHVIFSKDGATNKAGDFSAFVQNGSLYVLIQNGNNDYWIKAEDVTIEAGKQYSLAVTFGEEGVGIWVNGQHVGHDVDAKVGLGTNGRSLVLGGGSWNRDPQHATLTTDHLDGTVSNFVVFDRNLDRFEINALNHSGALPADWSGTAAVTGDQPAVRVGTGLRGEVFDRSTTFNSIDDLIAQSVTKSANFHLVAKTVDFGGHGEVGTLGEFLGLNGTLTDGGASTQMTTIGMHLTGFIWLEKGSHLVSVRSDDGFHLNLGGDELSSYPWNRGFESTSKTINVAQSGLYAVDLYYFENSGSEGLRFDLDGKTVSADRLFASVADYQAALTANGPMPEGGLPPSYDGPVGTTGTGLDKLVQIIGQDEGLQNNISTAQVAAGAAAADKINHIIVDAVKATGALDDGHITVAETYDISDYIRAHNYTEFVAAHGDDENGVETGFHLIQGDGGTSYLFGEDAVNTVMDGIYHIGFSTQWDRFVNEDGNANARVETVAYWLNELLTAPATPAGGAGTGKPEMLGSAAKPNVVVDSGLTSRLAESALNLTLKGTATNGIGNSLDNKIIGNDQGNQIDGGAGNDTLVGNGGDDTLVGGTGKDTMTGGEGDDTYYVDNAGDAVRESGATSGGVDTIQIQSGTVASYTMGTGIEKLFDDTTTAITLTGNSLSNQIRTGNGTDKIDGGAGNDTVFAAGGDDALIGGKGNDELDGGTGADTMNGGLGNDTYRVDNAGDKVGEKAGEGNDTVQSSIDYTLGSNVENLVLIGGAVNGIGNALDNTITGNGRDNTLKGGEGADRMAGGGGNDTYMVDNVKDVVIEADNQGIDRVMTTVTYTLAANVEHLVMYGTASIDATGNGLANSLNGNNGNNTLIGLGGDDALYGLAGNDKLEGGLGADRLTGGDGADTFIFATASASTFDAKGRDTIKDFSHAQGDRIDLHLIDANGVAAGDAAFHLVSAFDGSTGALTVSANAGGGWLVSADINGDKSADFAILVMSDAKLVAADFVM